MNTEKNKFSKGLGTPLIVTIILVAFVVGISFYMIRQQTQEAKKTQEEAPMKSDEVMMEGEIKVFDLTGKNYAFSQTEIRVKKGDTVRINFKSIGGFHDWMIDEFNAGTQRVSVEDEASVEFVADKRGTFEYYCSVGNHRQLGMKGNLIVE